MRLHAAWFERGPIRTRLMSALVLLALTPILVLAVNLYLAGRMSGDARRLNTCMQGLTASQRQSVALAFFDGLSHAEVAAHLHQPLGTVKSWVRRALLSLKECLERAAQRDTVGA